MAASEVIYMTNDSGDVWAVVIEGDDAHITATCGPLDQSEITQANLDEGAFNWDTDPEQIAWAEESLTRRKEGPYTADIERDN